MLDRPVQAIAKGDYRTYLAPTAVADLMDTVAYGGLGEASLRQGHSAFSKLEQGEATLSEQFSLEENFQQAGVPRFNQKRCGGSCANGYYSPRPLGKRIGKRSQC